MVIFEYRVHKVNGEFLHAGYFNHLKKKSKAKELQYVTECICTNLTQIQTAKNSELQPNDSPGPQMAFRLRRKSEICTR